MTGEPGLAPAPNLAESFRDPGLARSAEDDPEVSIADHTEAIGSIRTPFNEPVVAVVAL